MKSSRFVGCPWETMGMEGKDLAGEEKSRESHNGTSCLRKGAETDCGQGLHVNGFPGYHWMRAEPASPLSFFEPKYC